MAEVDHVTPICKQDDNDNDNGNGNGNNCEAQEIRKKGGGEDEDEDEGEGEYAYAPKSYWVSKDEELDWLDRNAYLDRKDSGNGKAGGVGVATSSQRYSGNLKSKASLLALPKPHKQLNTKNHHRHGHGHGHGVRLFPKRSEPIGPKPTLSINEPGSPKVSCMGRVRSRGANRSRSRSRNKSKDSQPQPSSALVRNKNTSGRKSGFGYGFWNNFRSIFRSKPPVKDDIVLSTGTSTSSNHNHNNKRAFHFHSDPIHNSSEAPSLGGMKRFASGRKSDAWAADAEVDGAKSEPFHVRGGGGPIWRRREVASPLDDVDVTVNIHRDWRNVGVGPISV